MILLRQPNDAFVVATADALKNTALTYTDIGATRHSGSPDGYETNTWATVVGNGDGAYRNAVLALRRYEMLNLGWLRQIGPVPPIEEGGMVCILARLFGVSALNVGRIVYVDNDVPNRFGFAYGTTTEYPIAGEERFSVSLNETSGEVTFDIFSFSRPISVIGRGMLPFLRRLQRRFCVVSSASMASACVTELPDHT